MDTTVYKDRCTDAELCTQGCDTVSKIRTGSLIGNTPVYFAVSKDGVAEVSISLKQSGEQTLKMSLTSTKAFPRNPFVTGSCSYSGFKFRCHVRGEMEINAF